MKLCFLLFMVFIVTGSLFLQGSPTQTQPELEQQIWHLEESYWEYWIKGDFEGYLSLLHEGFLGWPSSAEKPRDKKSARKFVENYVAQIKPFEFEIHPAGISIITNVAVVHYSLTWKDKDGKQMGNSNRITHTWIKQGDTWKVMGGMSSLMNAEGE